MFSTLEMAQVAGLWRRIGGVLRWRSARRGLRVSAATVLVLVALTTPSGAAGPEDESSIDKSHDAIIFPRFPDDRPAGSGATVVAVSRKRVLNLRDATLSTFIAEYAPGGSVVLPRSTAYGYVLMHVLSGSIKATAWEAGVGTYREGETWVFPAYGNRITMKNADAGEPARVLLVLVQGEAPSKSEPQSVSESSAGKDLRARAMPAHIN